METPSSVRRNPPRKAKMLSAGKTEPKPSSTARTTKFKLIKGKALLPSFEDSVASSRPSKRPPPLPLLASSRPPQNKVKHSPLKGAESLLPTYVPSLQQMASEECRDGNIGCGLFASSVDSMKLGTINVMQFDSSTVRQSTESSSTPSGSMEQHHGSSSPTPQGTESSMVHCETLKSSIQERSLLADDCGAESVINSNDVNPVTESVSPVTESTNPVTESTNPVTVSVSTNTFQGSAIIDDITKLLANPLLVENPSATNTSLEQENPSKSTSSSMNMHVYLRIRPARVNRGVTTTKKTQKIGESLIANWQSWKCPIAVDVKASVNTSDICLHHGSNSVTLVPPPLPSGFRRSKVEEFNGFSHIFSPDASQEDVFSTILLPRLIDLRKGVSSLVVAMGPTSAGKTYTMLGTSENPGLLPRSLQHLLGKSHELPMIALSMFEIYSEQGGRSEKILDLLQDGAELNLQQHQIKGLHEAFVSTAEEASSIVLNGLRKRTTASTAANHCSSRSHCIINISTTEGNVPKDEHLPVYSKRATLTIADLAGFERERKTGNQGVRLIESNFINNTSMVFGQCLRALLEHQKNPKKALQKHFQYSMLTRYLKPYMEAKGNMTLIINVSPCEEDYLDTAFVLRQAAPYSAIKLNLIPPKKTIDKPDSGKRAFLHQYGHYIKKRRKVDGSSMIDDKPDGSHVTQTSKEVEENSAALNSDVQSVLEVENSEVQPLKNLDSDPIAYTKMETSPILHELVSEKLELTVIDEVSKILIQNQVENYREISRSIYEVFLNAFGQHHDEVLGLKYRMEKQVEIQEQCDRSERLSTLGISHDKQETCNLVISENITKHGEDGKAGEEDTQTTLTKLGQRKPIYKVGSQPDKKLVNINASLCQDNDDTMDLSNTCQDMETGRVVRSSLCKVDTAGIKFEGTHAKNDTTVIEDSIHLVKENPLSKTDSLHFPDNLIAESDNNFIGTNMCLDICSYKDSDCEFGVVKEESLIGNTSQSDGLVVVSEDICKLSVDLVSKTSFQDIPKHVAHDPMVVKEVEDCGLHIINEAQLNEFPLQVSDSEDEFESNPLTVAIPELVTFKPVRLDPVPQVTHCDDECQREKPVQEVSTPLKIALPSCEKGEKCGHQFVQIGTPLVDSRKPADPDSRKPADPGIPKQIRDFKDNKESMKLFAEENVSNLPTEARDTSHSCVEESEVSSFSKGRLLALSLIKNPEVSSGLRCDHKHCDSATSMITGPIGPIGLDLEKVLDIPFLEIEKALWEPETCNSLKLSQTLVNHGGILDINKISRRFPKQRSFCLRYCLAVICGQMNVDGRWFPLMNGNSSCRKKHFYAIIKAKTVSEAVGHAKCGIQEELLFSNLPTKNMEGHNLDEIVIREKAMKSGAELLQAEDDKENKVAPSLDGKSVAPKRRKLQPISSLCLQLGNNNIISDFGNGDDNTEETCTAMLPRKANSLANLLMGSKK